jgi:ABC-type branched-subunit amino acid transport system ATPase component
VAVALSAAPSAVVAALDDVCYGRSVGLIGPNGWGKLLDIVSSRLSATHK